VSVYDSVDDGRELLMAVDCQALVAGAECEVLAVGRCDMCLKAFCGSHQAQYWDTTFNRTETVSDRCRSCFAAASAEAEAQFQARQAAKLFGFESHRAVDAMRSSGARKVDLQIDLGASNPTAAYGTGWILGEFQWKYPTDAESDEVGPYVTALLDHDDRQDLLRVVKVDDSTYRVIRHGHLCGSNRAGVSDWYDEVESVVRRLALLPQESPR
jgi:hypothetical protein